MATQVQQNAEVVAELASSDWRMAHIIACSVAKGSVGAQSANAAGAAQGKVTVREFARMVKAAAGGTVYGMGERGITSALAKWDAAAAAGEVPAAESLTPRDANLVIDYPDRPWKAEDGSGSKVRDVVGNAPAVAEALRDPRFAARVSALATPAAKQNVAREFVDEQALDDVHVKQKVRGQITKHDESNRQVSDATVGGVGKGIKDAFAAQGDKRIYDAAMRLVDFMRDCEAGKVQVVAADRRHIDRITEAAAFLQAQVAFAEVAR